MTETFLTIPHVLGIDRLCRAVASTGLAAPPLMVVDNSDDGLDANAVAAAIFRPPVPLTFSQTMNLCQRLAFERGCPFYFCMHDDAEAEDGTVARLVALVDELEGEGRRWAAVFTHYDALVAFRTAAVREAGAWDTTLPQYFADNDYYRRLRLAGFELVESGLPVRHEASSTIRGDAARMHANGIIFPLYEHYYSVKWGGKPGTERYTRPFNK